MTGRPQLKRGLRRVIQSDDGPLASSPEQVRTREPSVSPQAIEQTLSLLAQQIQAAAPDDRIEVLRVEGYETFENLRELGMTHEQAVSNLSSFATERQHHWTLEADIAEIIREVTDASDPIPFEDDADMAKPRDGTSGGLHSPGLSELPTLALSDWIARDLPSPDYLLGSVLSTTSRMLLSAETGIGKTNLAIAIGLRVASGKQGFLHWTGSGRPRKVLYFDGEMSRRLLRLRLGSEVQRLGSLPETFYALCAEDIDFKPLNTAEGQAYLLNIIAKIGGVDLVILDNIMSLVTGSMVDELSWAEVMPLVRSLTKQCTGQVWIHHTGHNEKRAYGTKTKEWGMDTVALLEQVKRPDTDLSFKMSFPKARERAPWNRSDFQDVQIALVDDAWVYTAEQDVGSDTPVREISPTASKFLEALKKQVAGSGDRSVDTQDWIAACGRAGLVDLEGKPNAVRALFYKYRTKLVAAGMVGFEGDRSWLIA